jgi:uncharacterized membrane protein YoaK (UPF0700 family)
MIELNSDSSPSETQSDRELHAAGSLPAAMLLACTGGGLDAFVYLDHGHVFAAAMTGNGIFLGVAVLQHNWPQAGRHLVLIASFVAGVFCSKALAGTLKRHAITVGLLGEIGVLFFASWLPGSFPDGVFVPMLAVVAAYQVASFRTADSYSYNSTFMTGNLRNAIDGLYDAFTPGHRESGLRQFRELALIVASFLTGAIGGAVLAPRLFNHTLWFLDLPLLVVLAVVVRRSRNLRENV